MDVLKVKASSLSDGGGGTGWGWVSVRPGDVRATLRVAVSADLS
jgi:hypothetical protein